MPFRSALVLTVDGLHCGFLGPYGNSWIQTPEFDALAAESVVFDHAFVSHLAPRQSWERLWGSQGDDTCPAGRALAGRLAESGLATCLITDDPELANHPAAADFNQRFVVPVAGDARAAVDIAETHLAELFTAAAEWLTEMRTPFLLWVHARGTFAPWDVPYELRARYADPEDPPTPNYFAVPSRQLPPEHDPDEVLGVAHAYAGQITLLDTCLGALRSAFAASPLADSTLWCLLGAGGFALGEHGWIGGHAAPAYSERIQIPWLLRLPDGRGALARSAALVQHPDLPATLAGWFGEQAALLSADTI